MIACLTVPYFAAAVERRDDGALRRTPLVIGGQPWEPRPVYAFSQEVARQGVAVGMPLRQAHVLSPRSHFMAANQPGYLLSSGELVDLLTDFADRLEPEDIWQPGADRAQRATADGRTLPARYYLDLEGLPLTEAMPLARHIGQTVRTTVRLAPAIGLAPHKFAAQVAAGLTRPNHARAVPPDEVAAFLAPRPITFLPLPPRTTRRLRLLGIDTLGRLAELPRSAVYTQFGPELGPFHQLAQGAPIDPLRPRPPTAALQATLRFDGPVADRQALDAALRRLATELAGRLQSTGREGRALSLVWETAEGDDGQRRQPLRHPTADPARLATILGEMLDAAQLSTGVSVISVVAGELTPAVARQLALFEPLGTAGQARRTLDDVAARHGADRLVRAVLTAVGTRPHPLPERRFQWQPLPTP